MDCERARLLLHPFLDDELAPLDSFEVSEHLSTCPNCSVERASALRLRSLLRERLRREEAPEQLRSRLARAGRRRVPAVPGQKLLLAAGLALLVLPVVADSGRRPLSEQALLSETPVQLRMRGRFFCLKCALARKQVLPTQRSVEVDQPHTPAFRSADGQIWILLNQERLLQLEPSGGDEVVVQGKYFVASHLLEADGVEK